MALSTSCKLVKPIKLQTTQHSTNLHALIQQPCALQYIQKITTIANSYMKVIN